MAEDWHPVAASASRSGHGDIAELLSQVRLFAGLEPAVLADLAGSVMVRNYARGQTVFHEGDAGDALLMVVSGRLSVFRISAMGERVVLEQCGPGQILGEIALLDRAPRSASVEAVETSQVLSLPRLAFLELLRSHPRLLDPLLRTLGVMVRRLTDQASDHVFLDLGGRVAKTLLRLGDAIATGDATVQVDITQGRLAEMVGAARQSVNQVLGGFIANGLVEVVGRSVRLVDRPALRIRAGLSLPPAAGD